MNDKRQKDGVSGHIYPSMRQGSSWVARQWRPNTPGIHHGNWKTESQLHKTDFRFEKTKMPIVVMVRWSPALIRRGRLNAPGYIMGRCANSDLQETKNNKRAETARVGGGWKESRLATPADLVSTPDSNQKRSTATKGEEVCQAKQLKEGSFSQRCPETGYPFALASVLIATQ